ncbi:hypothetical protein NMY22_g14147 [Coprinellus aureogranulatus]|nr:hypothetical protein NMY22_g14147 [Coprinellus aureogranulatus]
MSSGAFNDGSAPGSSPAFLARAQRDLNELQAEDDPAIRVFPREADDAVKACLVLTPYGGKWHGFRLHFCVELPLQGKMPWPVFPPRILPEPGFVHNLFPQGRGYQFPLYDFHYLSMSDEDGVKRLWREKYLPSHTLLSIFRNILHLISSTSVHAGNSILGYDDLKLEPLITTAYLTEEECSLLQMPIEEARIIKSHFGRRKRTELRDQWNADPRPDIILKEHQVIPTSTKTVHKVKSPLQEPGRIHQVHKQTAEWYQELDYISGTRCNLCSYGSPELPHAASMDSAPPNDIRTAVVPSSLLVRPRTCKLGMLLDDSFTEIAKWLSSASIRTFAAAYYRFDRLVSQHKLLQVRQLRCSLLRKPEFNSALIGVRITEFRFWDTSLIQPEWISLPGFEEHSVDIEMSNGFWDRPPDPGEDPEMPYHERPTLFLPLGLSLARFRKDKGEIMRRLDMLHEALYRNRYRDAPTFAQLKCRFCTKVHTIRPPFFSRHAELANSLRHLPFLIHSMTLISDWKISNRWHISFTNCYDTGSDDSKMDEQSLATETDAAAAWYCQLLHLALLICRDNPHTVPEAKAFVRKFLADATLPPKMADVEPQYSEDRLGTAMGFVSVLSVLEPTAISDGTPPVVWSTVNGPILRKFFLSAARWYLNQDEYAPLLLTRDLVSVTIDSRRRLSHRKVTFDAHVRVSS